MYTMCLQLQIERDPRDPKDRLRDGRSPLPSCPKLSDQRASIHGGPWLSPRVGCLSQRAWDNNACFEASKRFSRVYIKSDKVRISARVAFLDKAFLRLQNQATSTALVKFASQQTVDKVQKMYKRNISWNKKKLYKAMNCPFLNKLYDEFTAARCRRPPARWSVLHSLMEAAPPFVGFTLTGHGSREGPCFLSRAGRVARHRTSGNRSPVMPKNSGMSFRVNFGRLTSSEAQNMSNMTTYKYDYMILHVFRFRINLTARQHRSTRKVPKSALRGLLHKCGEVRPPWCVANFTSFLHLFCWICLFF